MNSFEKEVNNLADIIAQNYGLDPLTGKIFITLYLEPEEISLEELANITGYGMSTISTKMTTLAKAGIIKKVKKPGSRKVYYFMEKNLKQIVIGKLQMSIQSEIFPTKAMLPGILKKHKSTIMKSKDEKLKRKYRIMESYLAQMIEFEKIMNRVISDVQKIKEI